MATMRHILELLVNPFFLCLLVLIICTVFIWRGASHALVRNTLLILCISFVVISTGWLPRFMTNKLESSYPLVTRPDPAIKWIVVLSGGQSKVDGMPVNDLLAGASIKRLIEGIRLLRLSPKAQLVLSGGGSVGDQPEALLMAELSQWFSIPENKITLELKSINTADQARELVGIIGKEPFYLVTSAIHMPRSMALCQEQGLRPIAAPTDYTFFWDTESWGKMVIPNTYNLAYFSIAMHEVLGRIWSGLLPYGIKKPD